MKITDAAFQASYTALTQLPKPHLPEIAFAGRSNVGKSSLINRLLGRKNLARTSSTPGKTRQLNFILVNERLYFVDLPGYGFAKVSQAERQSWRRLIEGYIQTRPSLRLVIGIIDARHGPTASDLELIEWLAHLGKPALIVATKFDKIKSSQARKTENQITQALQSMPIDGPMFFSAVSGLGKNELLQKLERYLEP